MRITRIRVSKSIKNHESAQAWAASALPNPYDIPIEEVVRRITKLTDGLRKFWSGAEGWAPIEAAQLLSRSRLDWQVSLSSCLGIWIEEHSAGDETGRLILAWANLGSLVEGAMKLLLSVWYETYREDSADAIVRRGKLQDPDGLQLESLRQYFRRIIWDETWDEWVRHIQQRRNTIHAYKGRDIGTYGEFLDSVRTHLKFLRYINFRLPYPDEVYEPREV